MKNIYALCCILLLLISCGQKESDCQKFHTGTFTYPEARFAPTIITRTETSQTEINTKRNVYLNGSIKWTSDCEYDITLRKVSANVPKKMLGQTLHTTIVRVDGDIATCRIKGAGKEMTVKIKKLK